MRLLIAALSLFVVGIVPAAADPSDRSTLKDGVPHMTTTGVAEAEVVPDEADLQLGVSIERPEAQAAAAAVAEAAISVIADVKARGIEPKDIRTAFTLEAKYDNTLDANGRVKASKLRGYAATETIVVRLRDMTKAGPVARALIDKGANEFRGITFRYSKEKEKRKELAAAAMRDALADAKTYTEAIGLKVGRVLQIGSEGFSGGEADMPSRRASPIGSVPIPTEPGTIRLAESITVVWEIEGKAP